MLITKTAFKSIDPTSMVIRAAYVVSFVSLLHISLYGFLVWRTKVARSEATLHRDEIQSRREELLSCILPSGSHTRTRRNGIRPIRPVFWSYNWLAYFLVGELKRILYYNACVARLRSVFQERFRYIPSFFLKDTKDIEHIKHTFLIQSIKWKNSEVKDLGFGCKRRANPRVEKKKKKNRQELHV